MELMNENEYFQRALIHIVSQKGRGTQNSLSIDTKLSDAYISQIINEKRCPTPKVQIRIANALGMDYLDFLALGKKLTGDRTDINLRDVAAARAGITEQASIYNKVDKYKVIAEVGEILDSGHDAVIGALVKNVQEFKRAVDTAKRLHVCEDELKEVREEIADLRKQVDRLSSPVTGADRQGASSEKAAT
jgi:transcriptional regulator with XRE-family HTH domain